MLPIATLKNLLPIVAPADMFNTLITVFFFYRGMIVALLQSLGILHVEPASPFNAGSIIQFIANARKLLHVLVITTNPTLLKTTKNQKKQCWFVIGATPAS